MRRLETKFFPALDLNDAAFVDDNLHGAKPDAFKCFSDALERRVCAAAGRSFKTVIALFCHGLLYNY